MTLSNNLDQYFGDGGLIASEVRGFARRREQEHLAAAVASALQQHATLIGEAGTGTGKTFAYLLPALLSGERVIISTGTKHLQDQLFQTDLPVISRVLAGNGLDKQPRACLLKGRGNYLCRHRLIKARRNPALRERKYQQQLQVISEWARQTNDGDITGVMGIPEDAMVWNYVTSNAEFCSQHDADELQDCFIFKARQRAQSSDIVVVNHHLLCADLALKEEGFGELLPSAKAFIIDEAHQLPDIAASFFGKKLTSRQLQELARDTIEEQLQDAPDMTELRDSCDRLTDAMRHFRLVFGVEPKRDTWVSARDDNRLEHELERLERALVVLSDNLRLAEGRGKGLDNCYRRSEQLLLLLRRFINYPPNSSDESSAANSGHAASADDETVEIETVSDQYARQYIYWYETSQRGFSLNCTPIKVDVQFRQAMNELQAAWIFTSATLAVGGDFSHFRARLGIGECDELQVDSPFDYRNNALLYQPPGLPEPSAPNYTESLLDGVLPVLEASQGRAFLLFTSHRALNIARQYFEKNGNFAIFSQGSMPKRELVEAFQSVDRAVLLGTSSFWEGVDVRGSRLSCVIIDKLPFGSPGDPLLAARIENMRSEGGNPFFEFQVPQAAINLKQGVGRLIRDVSDRGVLVLCDPRIKTKPYGQVFVDSLPPIPLAVDIDEVTRFFSEENYAVDAAAPVAGN